MIYEDGIYRELTKDELDLLLNTENIQKKMTLEGYVESLEKTNQVQDELINISLLATDEMYIMIEPLLEVAQVSERGLGKMVDMYVAMIIRGLKTIEEVPLRYREEVRTIIEQLDK